MQKDFLDTVPYGDEILVIMHPHDSFLFNRAQQKHSLPFISPYMPNAIIIRPANNRTLEDRTQWRHSTKTIRILLDREITMMNLFRKSLSNTH
jgi:hypothetical protein